MLLALVLFVNLAHADRDALPIVTLLEVTIALAHVTLVLLVLEDASRHVLLLLLLVADVELGGVVIGVLLEINEVHVAVTTAFKLHIHAIGVQLTRVKLERVVTFLQLLLTSVLHVNRVIRIELLVPGAYQINLWLLLGILIIFLFRILHYYIIIINCVERRLLGEGQKYNI